MSEKQSRAQMLQYIVSRIDSVEKEVQALAYPYDRLRETINLLKVSIGSYVQNLQLDIDQKQGRIDQLEKEVAGLKKVEPEGSELKGMR